MTAAAPREATLNQLVAGQAKAQQQFEELFRRLDRAEGTAGEARDLAKELVTILREQDTGAKLLEMRTEMRAASSEMRQDFVAANTRIRTDLEAECTARTEAIDALDIRMLALEGERNKVIGVASFFSWLSKVAPWLLAIAVAAFAGIESKGT